MCSSTTADLIIEPPASPPSPEPDAPGALSRPFLTVEELAERWGTSKRHVYTLHEAGVLSSVRIGDRLIRFAIADVERYEEANRNPATRGPLAGKGLPG